jgi:hypothetical protein
LGSIRGGERERGARLLRPVVVRADREISDRCYPLRGPGIERRGIWQYKVTDGGRVWFARVPDESVVIILEVHAGHPKETETRRR